MKVISTNKDITQLVTSIVWSGDYQQAARKLEVSVAASPTDPSLPAVNVATGSMLVLLGDSGNELFRGYVFSREKSSTSSELKLTAYDGLIYLIKSKGTYNFKGMTPEAITSKVADDFGIPVGDLEETGIALSFIADSQTIYDIIMQAYTGAGNQNGRMYMPQMDKGALDVIQKGSVAANYLLSDDLNISESTYSESIENMINRVRIYDENGDQAGIVQNADWIRSYGILQDSYKKESGKDPTTTAQSMLKGIEQTSSITATGNTDCITGRAVFIREPYSGLTGLFYIDTDQHTWQDGHYTMQLTINLRDVMDAKAMKQLVIKENKPKAKTPSQKSTSAKKKSTKSSGNSLLTLLEEGGYKQ